MTSPSVCGFFGDDWSASLGIATSGGRVEVFGIRVTVEQGFLLPTIRFTVDRKSLRVNRYDEYNA